jgi:subtilisin family serine protease
VRVSWILSLMVTMLLTCSDVKGQQSGLIVRDTYGSSILGPVCRIMGCRIVQNLGDPLGQVFLVAPTGVATLEDLLLLLTQQSGIVSVEINQLATIVSEPTLSSIPIQLANSSPVIYYGTVVSQGYLSQPSALSIGIGEAHSTFNVSGSGIVAIVDTGVDPLHPALAPVMLPGYDFVNNISGADEKGDLSSSTVAVLDGGGGTPTFVSPWTAAVVSQAAATALDTSEYAAFGHGTMVSGIIHLVAPTAKLLPLKAFSSNGPGYESDVIRAIYFAVGQGSKVVNMSFSFASASTAMSDAVNYASSKGVICVAAAGNEGQQIEVYPASFSNVMGVASISDDGTLSSFSDYGSQVAWVGAPGENIISTYPFGIYASSSGTSFSAPFVSGTVALLISLNPSMQQVDAAEAIAHTAYTSPQLNRGILDAYNAVESVEP